MDNTGKNIDLVEASALLKKVYGTFNMRDIDSTMAVMKPDVEWPNGMEGGTEHGHDAVRKYWTRQWSLIDPHVEPVDFEMQEDGRVKVKVHQVVHDLNGKLLADQIIYHIYQFENGLVKNMEIRRSE
jgi:hypothetical protein